MFCICLIACGSKNNATSSGISNTGNYTLRSAIASTYSSSTSQAPVLLNYTGMTGTLQLTNNSWEKSITYRGNTTTESGTFSSIYLNSYLGQFTMSSITNTILYSGSYQMDSAYHLTLEYDTFLKNNIPYTLTEVWSRN